MCNNNNLCNCFSGNNLWWILILILLFCNGCGSNSSYGGCGNYNDNSCGGCNGCC